MRNSQRIKQLKFTIMTIYQIYTNGVPTKHVFVDQYAANELSNKLKCMYKCVSVESFNVPYK